MARAPGGPDGTPSHASSHLAFLRKSAAPSEFSPAVRVSDRAAGNPDPSEKLGVMPLGKLDKTPLGFFALRIGVEKIQADLVNLISNLRNRVTLKVGDRVTLIRESSHSFVVRTTSAHLAGPAGPEPAPRPL